MANSTTVYNGKDGRRWIDVTENKTLTAADSGLVQNVLTDAITVTLPGTALGNYFIVRNGGTHPTSGPVGAVSDQSILVTVAPNASDGITGNGFTAANNKAALNTKATSTAGDELRVVQTGTAGTTGNVVTHVQGVWARAA